MSKRTIATTGLFCHQSNVIGTGMKIAVRERKIVRKLPRRIRVIAAVHRP